MRLPASVRRLARRSLGMGRVAAIAPEALHALAAREPVIVVGVGVVGPGVLDPRLPGDQRTASLFSLATVLADVPRAHPIVLHCG